jgi:glucose-6-phosphate-specific signal transduction histidine kinase
LVGIRERASELGGTFRIEGRGGKGTRLTIELPVGAEDLTWRPYGSSSPTITR